MPHARSVLAPLAAATLAATAAGALAGEAAAPAPQPFAISIPTVEAVNASMSGDALRQVFTGDVAGHAGELANLSADRISLPEISMTFPSGADGEGPATLVYKDIAITGVAAGKAARVTVGSAVMTEADLTFTIGAMTASDVDMAAALEVYGLVDAPAGMGMTPLYAGADVAPSTMTADNMNCDIGAVHVGAVRARPLKQPLLDYMAWIEKRSLAEKDKADMSAEDFAYVMGMWVDMVTAFETDPMQFDGFKCEVNDTDTGPFSFAFGRIAAGGYDGAHYPEITAAGIKVSAPLGSGSLDSLTFKPMDLSPMIDNFGAIAETGHDKDWFDAHSLEIMPHFGGFALTGLNLDVANPENPDQRIKAALGAYDLTLKDYHKGVPTDLSGFVHDLSVTLPNDTSDPVIALLQGLGLGTVNLSNELAMRWDPEAETISIDKVKISSGDLGSITLAGLFGNASEALLLADEDTRDEMSEKMTIKSVSLDVANNGLVDLAYRIAGALNGQDPETLKATASGMSQGMILMMLSANPNAQDLAAAVGGLLGGGKSMSATITARNEKGLGKADFDAIENNPTALGTLVDITASGE